MLRWPSPHTENVQSVSQVELSLRTPRTPSSHCSTPVSVLPSPQTLSLQLGRQRLCTPLFVPSSHSSPCSTTPLPQLTSWQVTEQVSPSAPLVAPWSQVSPASRLRWPSPHTENVQSSSQVE